MKSPIFRAPTRDAKDADHLAIIAVAGGIYLWWGRAGLSGAAEAWIISIAIASILSGILLWLRVPAAKWLGVVVFVAILGLGVRRLMLDGWSLRVMTGIVFPAICAFWMGRIDYNYRFVDDDEA